MRLQLIFLVLLSFAATSATAGTLDQTFNANVTGGKVENEADYYSPISEITIINWVRVKAYVCTNINPCVEAIALVTSSRNCLRVPPLPLNCDTTASWATPTYKCRYCGAADSKAKLFVTAPTAYTATHSTQCGLHVISGGGGGGGDL